MGGLGRVGLTVILLLLQLLRVKGHFHTILLLNPGVLFFRESIIDFKLIDSLSGVVSGDIGRLLKGALTDQAVLAGSRAVLKVTRVHTLNVSA